MPFEGIDAEEAAKLIEQGAKVIDVRHQYEYNHYHIEQAVLVPLEGLYSFAQGLEAAQPDKEAPLIFVCEVGQRSAAASEIAAIAGYKKIYNLEGGMNMWHYMGLPVITGK